MPEQVGSGSTSDRDNLTYIEDGDVFYNTETGQLQVRRNGAWTSLTKTITDTNAFKITSGTSLPSGSTTTTTTTNNFNTDLGEDEVLSGEQHSESTSGQDPVTKSYDLTTFGTNSGSLIGSEVYVYIRYYPGTSSEGDIQISQIKVNDVTYGITDFNDSNSDFYYTKWQTTYRTNNADYRHGDTNTGTYSEWSASWLDVVSIGASVTAPDPGRWARDKDNDTGSSNTGVDIGNSLYYEQSSGGRSNQGVTSVFLRTPKITLTSNTIEIGSYAYGSQIGTLYFGVYIEKKVSETTSPSGIPNNIFYNTSTGKIRIREESAWQVTSKRSIKSRDEFKILHGTNTPSVNTLQRVFYNTNTKKLQYLKNDSWRSVAEEEVAGDTFNVGVDSYKFSLNNAVQPELNLYRGNEYVFNQSDPDNSGQRLYVSNDVSGRLVDLTPIANHNYPFTNDLNDTIGNANLSDKGNSVVGYSVSEGLEIDPNITNYVEGTLGDLGIDGVINRGWTLSAWVKLDSGDSTILFGSDGPPDNVYKKLFVMVNGHYAGRTSVGFWGGDVYFIHPPNFSSIVNTTYVHYVIIYDHDNTLGGGAYKKYMYINGTELVSTSNGSTLSGVAQNKDWQAVATDKLTIGSWNYGPNPAAFVKSYWKNLSIYHSALSGEQVTLLYNKGQNFSPNVYLTTISENTTGFTSTGTLGTDLVSTWKIPTDASDTMYYASDGSANAGGKINITDVPAQEKTFAVDVSFGQTPVVLAGGYGGLKGTGGSEGTALQSSAFSTSQNPATKVFNGLLADSQDCWVNAAYSTAEEWLKFEFPYDVTITSYKMWERTPATHAFQPVGWKLHSFTASQPFDSTNYNINDTNTLIDTRTSSQNSDNGISMTPQITPDADSIVNDDTFRLFNIPLANQKQGRTIVIFFPYPDSRGFRNNVNWILTLGELAYYGFIDSPTSFVGRKYILNNEIQPTLNLYRDSVYKFDQSDPDNVGQRLYVSNDADGRGMVLDPNNRIAEAGGDGGLKGTGGAEGTAGESHSFHPEYTYLKIFDNNLTGSFISGNNESGWATSLPVEIYFEFPTAKVIKAYSLWASRAHGGHGPGIKAWELRASSSSSVYDANDSTTWTELDSQSNVTNWDDGNNIDDDSIEEDTKNKKYLIQNNTAYKYYVLHITASNHSNGQLISLGQIAYYSYGEIEATIEKTAGVTSIGTLGTDLVTTWRVPTDASDTMYYASDGSANIGGTINITDAPTKKSRVRTLVSAGSNSGGDTYTSYAVDVSLNRFTIGGHMQPTLNLYKDSIYRFDQSDPDNSGQRLYVSNDLSGRVVSGNAAVSYALSGPITITGQTITPNTDIDIDWTGDWRITFSYTNVGTSPTHGRVFSFISDGGEASSSGEFEWYINEHASTNTPGFVMRDPFEHIEHYATFQTNDNVRINAIIDYKSSSTTLTVAYEEDDGVSDIIWNDILTNGNVITTTNSLGTFTPRIVTYHTTNSRIGGRTHDHILTNTTIHSFTVTNGTSSTSLSENTNGFTSTGTLGTDLVSTWKIPTDASDTMYYASDGSANAGGKINVEVTPYEEKTYAANFSALTKNIIGLAGGQDGLRGTGGIEGTVDHYSAWAGVGPLEAYGAQKAFNGTLADTFDTWHSQGSEVNNWVSFTFPYDVTITKYKIWTRPLSNYYPPKAWELRLVKENVNYVESDITTYTVIHDVSGQVLANWPGGGGTSGSAQPNSIDNDTERLEFHVPTENQEKGRMIIIYVKEKTGTYTSIGELAYYGYHDNTPSQYTNVSQFAIDSQLQPTLNLYRDSVYKFDQSDASNVGQRLFVSNNLDGRANIGGSNASIQFPRQAMTSNSSQDCVASASTTQDSPGAYAAFDKTTVAFWHSGYHKYDYNNNGHAFTGSSYSSFESIYGEWIKIHFQVESFKLKELVVYARDGQLNRGPDEGYVFGSLDGSTWSQLVNFTGIANSGGYNGYQNGVGKTINVSATTEYSYYVLLTTKLSGNDNNINISRIDLNSWDPSTLILTENTAGVTSTGTLGTDLITRWRIPTDASDTMYYASDGSANIGGTINISNVPHEEKTYAVDVSLNRFTLGGIVQPTLNVYRDSVYKFDQSDPDNVGQRLYVSNNLNGRAGINYWELSSPFTLTNNWSHKLEISDQTLDWSNKFYIKIVYTPTNDMNTYGQGQFGRLFDFETQHEGSAPYFTIAPGRAGSDDRWYFEAEDENDVDMINVKDFYHINTTPGDYPIKDNKYNLIVEYNNGILKISNELNSSFTSWDNTLSNKLITQYTIPINSRNSITYDNCYIGNRDSNWNRPFVGTIHSFEIAETLTTISENTAGVTSNGTLGTDLVTRWRVPTDASDTMYYASDGSANAGGTINILYSTPTIVCLTASSVVNVISSGGNKYRFNGDSTYVANKYYGLGGGTFTLTGVPSGHPIAILNAGKTSLISYTGDIAKKSIKTVSGTSYDFYHGDVTVTVSGDFGSVSVYCFHHGYMGGENLLRYSSSCDIPSSSGGIETQYGGYRIHTFTSSGTFEVYNNMDVDCLIIGGGGGGCDGDDFNGGGGGGGAGGYLEVSQTLTPGQYPVVVGAGGIGSQLGPNSASNLNNGVNGNDSSFNQNIAIGGGAGSTHNAAPGDGGCGGGGFRTLSGGNGSQGGDGGSGGGLDSGGGGGGGANEDGGNGASGTNKFGGDGGDGKVSSITGTATHYAGGGGGGAQDMPGGSNYGRSNGGQGGGGQGGGDANNSAYYNGLSGTDGLGGGGGGSSAGSGIDNLAAGNGGDGIVIIRYLL